MTIACEYKSRRVKNIINNDGRFNKLDELFGVEPLFATTQPITTPNKVMAVVVIVNL